MDVRLVAACIVFWGISAFFRKLAVERLHPFQLQVVSSCVYICLIPVWLHLCKFVQATKWDLTGVFYMVVCTLLYTVASLSFGFLLKGSHNVGVIAALTSLSPVVTLAMSILFLDERFSVWKAVAFVLAVTSAILINF